MTPNNTFSTEIRLEKTKNDFDLATRLKFRTFETMSSNDNFDYEESIKDMYESDEECEYVYRGICSRCREAGWIGELASGKRLCEYCIKETFSCSCCSNRLVQSLEYKVALRTENEPDESDEEQESEENDTDEKGETGANN